MIEIAPNVIVETQYLGSNNTIICTRDGNVLVDAPHRPSDAVKWRRIVESCGGAAFLINTDNHIDHTLCNSFLPGQIVSHEITRDRLLNNAPTRRYIDDLLAAIDPAGKAMYMGDYAQRVPTITYRDRMTLVMGGLTIELHHLPGHTPANTLIHLPELGIACTGDLVCEAGLPAFIDADVFACLEAVRRIEALGVKHIVPGHGQVCGLAEARRFGEQIEALMARVQSEIDRGQSREQIVAEVAYEDRIHIATPDSAGYPDHLIDWFMKGSIAAIHDQLLARLARAA